MIRAQRFGVSFASVLVLAACATRKTDATPDAGELRAAASNLATFLPATIGPFTAETPATTSVSSDARRVEAARAYVTEGGRTLTVRLGSGDVRAEERILASRDEHAFGSDSPTYWRTTEVEGWRARIAEERVNPSRSEAYLQVGRAVVVVTITRPVGPAESASLAALLDLHRLATTSGRDAGAER